jgi:nucleoside-diphosphate-sugar epimerase
MKNRNVLITGGCGYIGSVLTEILLKDGYTVTVLDSLAYDQMSVLHHFGNENFHYVYGDVRDHGLILKQIQKHDIIIPLAAIVGAPSCNRNPRLATDINFTQIKNIVNLLSKDQQIIVPNTNSQYGSSTEIITEESSFKPLSHYARTKCDAEDVVLSSGNGIALRLATVFGVSPRMRLDLLVNDFTYQSYSQGVLVLFESHFKRNYIHVRDVSYAFKFMIENYNDCNNEPYNVGLSDSNLSKMELALKIKEYVPGLVIKKDEFAKDKDKRNYIVSNEKIEKAGWSPQFSIDRGIKELLSAMPIFKNKLDQNFTNL